MLQSVIIRSDVRPHQLLDFDIPLQRHLVETYQYMGKITTVDGSYQTIRISFIPQTSYQFPTFLFQDLGHIISKWQLVLH